MGRRRHALILFLLAVTACASNAPVARANLFCATSCSRQKDQCVLAAGNAAELELCGRKDERCRAECTE